MPDIQLSVRVFCLLLLCFFPFPPHYCVSAIYYLPDLGAVDEPLGFTVATWILPFMFSSRSFTAA